ncbi:hypothetical protein [Endozoicomonas sp. 4G]|uniref:hypothetical protein n=1 Tax=Endozoicomonas sp. 4G TaxID=2872754 RepID=UPI002078E875|nr:hypothetical protein [Endozoicomonas sp. 4G]
MTSSRPVIEFELELQTRQAQSMKNWLTHNLGGMFYMLEVVFRDKPELDASLTQTINEISEAFDDLDDDLLVCLDEQEQKKLPYDNVSLKYSNPKNISVECSTPQLLCCQQLLNHFDQIVQVFDKQWLLKEITRQEHQQNILAWMQKVSKVLFECNKKYRSVRHQVMAQAEALSSEASDSQEALPLV